MRKTNKTRLLGRKLAEEMTHEDIEKASGGYAGNASTATHDRHGPDQDILW